MLDLKIDKNNLKVHFYCDEQMNLRELEEYYFTSKVFKAIRSFSDKMKLKPDVFINNEKWMAFYEI